MKSRKPHLSQREEGSGHAATVVAEECNYRTAWLDSKMLTSAKYVVT